MMRKHRQQQQQTSASPWMDGTAHIGGSSAAATRAGGPKQQQQQQRSRCSWSRRRGTCVAASLLSALLLGVLWASTGIASDSRTLTRILQGHHPPIPPGPQWYKQHQEWLLSHAGEAQRMQDQLQQHREQLGTTISLHDAAAALRGSRLPKGVALQQARQLLIDTQLLGHSMMDNSSGSGFAAARVAAVRRYYGVGADSTTNGSSSSSSSSSASGGSSSSSSSSHHRHDRGILIVGGSRTHLGNAYVLLRMLRRHLGCRLPVEVVFYGRQELDPAAARLVAAFAAEQAATGAAPIRLIDGAAVHARHLAPLLPHPEPRLSGWVAKVHALCWVTSFRHVLLLDSDNLPVQDPERLFDSPAFTSHGVVLWPDFWRDLWMEPAVYRLLGLDVPWQAGPGGSYLAAESGQLLLDRARHADVLEWLWLLNAHAGLVYRALVGDKDTYRIAFQLAGKEYWQVPQPPQQLLFDAGPRAPPSRRFTHLGMGQASPDGAALMFLHRTARGKYFPWCAASRALQAGPHSCRPSWLTLPVVQEQLLASVPDPGSMRYAAGALDTRWHAAACRAAPSAAVLAQEDTRDAGGGNGSGNSGNGSGASAVGQWAMPLPECVRSYSARQLPIPVIPVDAVPGLPALLAAAQAVFAEAAAVLRVPWVDRYKVFWGIL